MPDSGHISLEAIVIGLSALPRLTYLCIEFEQSGTIRLPPPSTVARALLPALTEFLFFGVSEYLEDIMARIELPRLKTLTAVYEQHVFDIRQIISHSQTLGPFDRGDVIFMISAVCIRLYQSEEIDPPQMLELGIDERVVALPGQQVSSLAQKCTLSSSLLSSVTGLDIGNDLIFSYVDFSYVDDSDLEVLRHNPEWLVLFHPFCAVRTLRLSCKLQSFIISSLLGHTRESVTEVLPGRQNLYLHDRPWQDSVEEQAIEQFIAARQNSDRPVTVHRLPENNSDWCKPIGAPPPPQAGLLWNIS